MTAALAALGAPSPAGARDAAVSQPRQPAAGQKRFAIPPQPLTDALALFGQQSGWQVSVHGALIDGLATPGVEGLLTPDQALRRLLIGTKLAYSVSGGDTVILRRFAADAARDGAVNLAPVMVEGEPGTGETARGPVQGYVATQSATATKTETPLIRTPQAISVIPRTQMDDQNVKSVAQSLRYSSGVFAEYRGSSNLHDETFIRGFGYAPRMLDGLGYGSGSIGQIDPWLLERVEVLRGPSSMLYGQTNPGGLINLVSKRPSAKAAHEIRVEAGDNGRLEGAFDLGGPATEDGDLLYRVVGLGNRFDLDEDFSQQERVAVAPSLTWKPGDRTELTLLASYHNDPKAGYRNFLPSVGTVSEGSRGYGKLPRGFFISDPDFQRSTREQTSIGHQFEHRLDDRLTLRQNARYTHLESEYDTLSLSALQPDQRTLTRAASADREIVDQITVDNQLESRFATGPLGHTLLAGLDYRRTGTDSFIRRGTAPTIDWRNPAYHVAVGPMAPTSDQHAVASQLGLYLQDQVTLDRWSLLLGARHDRARTRIANRIGADSRRDDGHLSYRAGLMHNFENGLAPYASVSTSFEPELSTGAPGADPFKPTIGRQVELGVKYQPKGGAALFTATLFDIRQRNVVTYDSAIGYNVQIGEVHSRGVELEARGDLTRTVSLIASYSHVDAEVTRTTIATSLGRTPARIPGRQAALWVEYTGDAGALGGVLDGLSAGLGTRHIGESFGNATNTFKVPGVTLLDASLRYELGRLNRRLEGASVQVNASNLTDRFYVASCAGVDSCFFGSGRMVTASLGYRW
ncbi:TonB-dependent siderophore receptor [Azospirillum doebereinerae]|uniref:TonB-dependent siderophore receptor n=1 Tax=Azospirillum doebereinerae TaxID=92933 RepID=UPI001EE61F6E|nr:TonB-dependent siderophore receptor [Azospirillum doebereinerae]MCG5239954.1 TonB-dependent siderophore receptor [Azospirillum doebereinerae]